jgi:hypothetical protein
MAAMDRRNEQVEALKIRVRTGLKTINEVRAELGEAPRAEPEADQLLILTSGRGWLTLDNREVRLVVEDLLPEAFHRDVGRQ